MLLHRRGPTKIADKLALDTLGLRVLDPFCKFRCGPRSPFVLGRVSPVVDGPALCKLPLPGVARRGSSHHALRPSGSPHVVGHHLRRPGSKP